MLPGINVSDVCSLWFVSVLVLQRVALYRGCNSICENSNHRSPTVESIVLVVLNHPAPQRAAYHILNALHVLDIYVAGDECSLQPHTKGLHNWKQSGSAFQSLSVCCIACF